MDRALSLPQEWTEDSERRKAAQVPEEVEFATKPQLAREMLSRALASGLPCQWMTADEAYGSDHKFRCFCEEHHLNYVVAILPIWRTTSHTVPTELHCSDLSRWPAVVGLSRNVLSRRSRKPGWMNTKSAAGWAGIVTSHFPLLPPNCHYFDQIRCQRVLLRSFSNACLYCITLRLAAVFSSWSSALVFFSWLARRFSSARIACSQSPLPCV